MSWKLAEAKNKFSEVVQKALTDGPQKIQRRNDTIFVVSEADYKKLSGEKPGFKDLLLSMPETEDLNLERDKSPMRDIDLP